MKATLALFLLCVTLFFGLLIDPISGTLTEAEKQEWKAFIDDRSHAHVNSAVTVRNGTSWEESLDTHLKKEHVAELVDNYIETLEWKRAFREATGMRPMTFIVVFVIIMIFPGLLITLGFFFLTIFIKGLFKGGEAGTCAVCKCGKTIITCGKC